MRVVVQWEGSAEIPFAKNLAEILSRMAADLAANGRVVDGNVQVNRGGSIRLPNLTVACEPLIRQRGVSQEALQQLQAKVQRAAAAMAVEDEPRKMVPPSGIRELDLDHFEPPAVDPTHNPQLCRRKRYFATGPVTGDKYWFHTDDHTICERVPE